MKKPRLLYLFLPLVAFGVVSCESGERLPPDPAVWFGFDGSIDGSGKVSLEGVSTGVPSFTDGLAGEALRLGGDGTIRSISIDPTSLPLGEGQDFSVQFWLRNEANAGTDFVVLA